jgi:hypothetical protein
MKASEKKSQEDYQQQRIIWTVTKGSFCNLIGKNIIL